MSLLAPGAAVLALTIPAILALYFLKIRRPTRIVPALHLWPDQIRDRQANVPWQRLRPSWPLFLPLLPRRGRGGGGGPAGARPRGGPRPPQHRAPRRLGVDAGHRRRAVAPG